MDENGGDDAAMKTLHPAVIRTEPATLYGTPFSEAAGRLCVWPISGSGIGMVCCGAKRKPGKSYCASHYNAAKGNAPLKPRLPRA